jgi:hypothetical protein
MFPSKDPKELEVGKCFKFVRVAGKYRFCTLYIDHCELVDKKTEKAESAGLIALDEDGLFVMSKRSETLNIGMLPEDYQALSEIFKKPIKDSFLAK